MISPPSSAIPKPSRKPTRNYRNAIDAKGEATSEDALLIKAERYAPVHDVHMRSGMQGAYLRQPGVILIDSHLSDIQRRCVLAHEISHARHMDAGCKMDKWTERRADMEAAVLLVDPMEYAYAETVYGGNIAGIARELDVLPWVIKAYHERLHDSPNLVIQ